MKPNRINVLKFPIAILLVGVAVLFVDLSVINLLGSREIFVSGVSEGEIGVNREQEQLHLIGSNKLALSLANAPIGKLGPANTSRSKFRYYDTLFYTALQFGHEASSLIEVGCSSNPFIQHLDWVDKRTCVAPYFVEYSGDNDGRNSNKQIMDTKNPIESVVADFMEYDLTDNSYDLLICSQVLEHVPDSSAFMKKLIKTAKTSIISVPYKWGDCGKSCNHVTHQISYDKLLEWSSPHKPIYSSIVQEKMDGKKNFDSSRRIILVFQPE